MWANACNHTQLDFFLLGFLKSKVYAKKPESLKFIWDCCTNACFILFQHRPTPIWKPFIRLRLYQVTFLLSSKCIALQLRHCSFLKPTEHFSQGFFSYYPTLIINNYIINIINLRKISKRQKRYSIKHNTGYLEDWLCKPIYPRIYFKLNLNVKQYDMSKDKCNVQWSYL